MGVCDVPVLHDVCNAAGDAGGALVTAPFDWLAQSMGGAAAWMFQSVWTVIDSTTYVDVTSGQYVRVYDIIFGIAVVLMIGFFLLQVISGMVRREPGALARAALGLAKSLLGSFVAITLLATALEVTDQLSLAIVHAAGTNMAQIGDKIALLAGGLGAINASEPGVGAIITIFVSSLAIVGAMVVWISLLVRKALLLVAIVFAPIAFAGSSWDHTRSWLSRWATFVLAMIVSKVVLVVIFLLATAQVASPIDADLQSVGQPIAGVVLMLMAGFAPYMTYKAIAFIGFDTHHAMSAEQETKSALNRPLPIPTGFHGSQPLRILDGGARQGGGGGASTGGPPSAAASAEAPPNGGSGTGRPPPPLSGAHAGAAGGSTSAAGGTSTGGAAGAGGASGGAGAAGAAGAAGGAVAAGALVATGAATAGPRLGYRIDSATQDHAESAPAGPPAPQPRVVDPTPPSPDGASRG